MLCLCALSFVTLISLHVETRRVKAVESATPPNLDYILADKVAEVGSVESRDNLSIYSSFVSIACGGGAFVKRWLWHMPPPPKP